MKKSASILSLSNAVYISEGKRQWIYDHPDDPSALIKIAKPAKRDGNRRLAKPHYFDRFRRANVYRAFLREMAEYLELKTKFPASDTQLPLCQVTGIVQTDIGLGLIYERIANPDGSLAKTLQHLIESKQITQQHLDELNTFFEFQIDNHVIVSNFNLLNIVYQIGENGSGRFLWIDSFGSKQFVPIRTWFKSQNTRKLLAIREKCLREMETSMSENS